MAAPVMPFAAAFPVDAVAAEVAAIDAAAWRRGVRIDPGGRVGVLPVVDADATDVLERLPALSAWLASLDAPWRCVEIHAYPAGVRTAVRADASREARDRIDLCVPLSGGFEIETERGRMPMPRGSGWAVDTARRHRVSNTADGPGLLLQARTAGSPDLAQRIGVSHAPAARMPSTVDAPTVRIEASRSASIDPWELRAAVEAVLGEAARPAVDARIRMPLLRLVQAWRGLWAEGEAACRAAAAPLADATQAELLAAGAAAIGQRNGLGLMHVLDAQVFAPLRAMTRRVARIPVMPAGAPAARDDFFDRPVFIVSLPRSGSTLLFETLMQARNVHTIGDESHALIEGIRGLAPGDRGFDSNRLEAADATPDIAASLRERFLDNLRDRDGHRSDGASRLRMLEKTPKNALRIAFLRAVFPEARFVYLHRDPRQVLASMIESWRSARFRTYPDLPDWSSLPWSLLLVPGWRELDGRPLEDVVGHQWATTSRILLDDLDAVPDADRLHVDYARLVADPVAELARICDWAGFERDRALGERMPLSRYTVSRPDAEKWRRHEAAVEAQLAAWPDIAARIEQANAPA